MKAPADSKVEPTDLHTGHADTTNHASGSTNGKHHAIGRLVLFAIAGVLVTVVGYFAMRTNDVSSKEKKKRSHPGFSSHRKDSERTDFIA